ncbi:MAG: hypothetical protein U5J64_03095 [Halobacteriales archaeon]|nr:hypothetical protein [Halobacteriales archaeon]
MENSEDGPRSRLVKRRRLVSFFVGVAVYSAVLVVASDAPGTTYTTHTVRYLTLVAVFYALLSGVNTAHGYVAEGALHADAPDFVGGVVVVVGLGVFYAEVLGADAGVGGANVTVLGFVTVAVVAGMLLVLKV